VAGNSPQPRWEIIVLLMPLKAALALLPEKTGTARLADRIILGFARLRLIWQRSILLWQLPIIKYRTDKRGALSSERRCPLLDKPRNDDADDEASGWWGRGLAESTQIHEKLGSYAQRAGAPWSAHSPEFHPE